jgi:SSS family solute:Na+ symporter
LKSGIDAAIVAAYLVGIVAFGSWFVRRNRSAERFMAAGRAIPGWAVGLTIFGSYVSSISFLALPGKAFDSNWNFFVFSLSLPAAAWIAARYFVPFYRKSGEISAYHHLEHRFGPWARTYAVVCYLLTMLVRTGSVMYLLTLPLAGLLGLGVPTLIVALGVVMTIYPLLGGTEAVIWTGVAQSILLVAGALVILAWLVFGAPGGPGHIFTLAAEQGKFSLGSLSGSLAAPTLWVVLAYGMAENLRNFGITQSYVQLYITARSDRAAVRSVWMSALLYIPVSAVFFFIGTALWAFYAGRPGPLPEGVAGDKVLPYFINTQLPVGIAGFVIAAICAAATDSNFNSMATLVNCDIYTRYFRPNASDRESLWVLRLSTLACGIGSTVIALAMTRARTVLDAWWTMAGIFTGGMLGLFLLGLVSRRAGNVAAILGVVVGVLVILWMTLSLPETQGLLGWGWPQGLRSEMTGLLINVFGTSAILLVGVLVGMLGGLLFRSGRRNSMRKEQR